MIEGVEYLEGDEMQELLINERVIGPFGNVYRVITSKGLQDHPYFMKDTGQGLEMLFEQPTKVFRNRRK